MVFNEIDNFIEVYIIIRLLNSYSVLGPRSLVRPNNSVPKHCIRSITYEYALHNLSVLGLCLRINDSGLFAWISLTALPSTYFIILLVHEKSITNSII